LADPGRFNGRIVTVEGYVDVGFERRFLLEKMPGKDNDAGNACITLLSAGRIMKDVNRYDRKRVRLTGTFVEDYGKLGIVHLGSCSLRSLDLDNSYQLQVM
jgi:hypothetical protein